MTLIKEFAVCLLVVFAPISVSAENYLGFEKGSVDLPKNEALAKPFTMLDQLLYSLKGEAKRISEFFRPDKDDFRLSYNDMPLVMVGYSEEFQRVIVQFQLSVQGMDDPWQQVCERHIRLMARILTLEDTGSWNTSRISDDLRFSSRSVFLEKMLGQDLRTDEAKVRSLQPFIDSIVIIGAFNVGKGGKLFFSRHCALDVKSNRMTFFEYKY